MTNLSDKQASTKKKNWAKGVWSPLFIKHWTISFKLFNLLLEMVDLT